MHRSQGKRPIFFLEGNSFLAGDTTGHTDALKRIITIREISRQKSILKSFEITAKNHKNEATEKIDKNQRMTHTKRKITDWSILNSKGKTFLLEGVTLEL